jgi:hypothetical protein
MGPNVHELVTQGVLHPALPGIVEYPDLFAHQAETLIYYGTLPCKARCAILFQLCPASPAWMPQTRSTT